MLPLTDFIEDPVVLSIFQEEAITDFRDFLFNLELYKFCTRSSIISTINHSGIKSDQTLDIQEIERKADFSEIERNFHVLINHVMGNQVSVIYSVDREVNRDAIELALEKYQVDFIAVTPYNYNELYDPSYSWVKYNPTILFKRILIEAINLRATDLHFCVEHVDMQATYPVKYRKDGNLLKMDLFTIDADLNKSIISNLVERKTDANSLDLITVAGVTAVSNDPLGNGDVELRIAANKVMDGWQCVIRIQQKETFSFEISKLGFPEVTQEALRGAVRKKTGIVFITGAIRTGKNTTAFAVLNEIVKEPVKIVSYESPIEVLMPFTQVDYSGDEETLLNAVRLAKKQDVNVAYINELPNKEVAFSVRDLVNSSIYVLTTMHMDRLWHLPYKLKEYYGEQFKDVISQISYVFNQKMFGIPCPHCRERVLSDTLPTKWRNFLKQHNVDSVGINAGCSSCGGIGLQQGKNQPYVEFLEFSAEIKDKLLACEAAWEMENVLKEAVMKSNVALEDTMLDAIVKEKLAVSALDYIL